MTIDASMDSVLIPGATAAAGILIELRNVVITTLETLKLRSSAASASDY